MKRSFDFRPWLKPALTVLLGLLLIFRPGSITNSIALCAGIILALFGAGKLIGFFTQSGAKVFMKLAGAIVLLLIGFASVFTLYLSLTGILTGSADAAAAKAVKTAVSAALPVVGSIVADAASTVTSSAAILRSGIGVVGVVSVAAMCVTPYLQFVMHYVLYKLAAGIAESFADKRVGRLIDGFADVYGFLLGMVGVASLILFLSIVSSMKAVTG